MKKLFRYSFDKDLNKEVGTYDTNLNQVQITCEKNNCVFHLDLDYQDFSEVKELYECLGEYIKKRGSYDD